MMRDPDFGPIRLRAFGTYNLQCRDPRALLEQLVGTDSNFETDELRELIRSFIVSTFADVVGTANVAALDLAANYQEIAETVREKVVASIDDEYGLTLPQLFIVNVSLPEEVEKALDTRSSMGVIGDMDTFQQYQMGQAMVRAAENPSGGGAAEGMGMGMGFAMANQMVNQMGGRAMGGQPVQPGQMAGRPVGAGGQMPPPVPVQPMIAWHVVEGGRSIGPFNAPQLAELVAQGRLTRESSVWRAGFSGWLQASDVPEVAGMLGPPPPPPE